jgi:hypothetical protein
MNAMTPRLLIGLVIVTTCISAQDVHHDAVDKRGDHVMGFSHENTTHHFRLLPDGGAIEVTVNNAKDTQTRDQIRMHLSHIAQMFADGDFEAPMLTHDRVPPGVPVLQRLKTEIAYRYVDIRGGGRVRISTKNEHAISAVHDFLKFQISDHRTGDPTEVRADRAGVK